MSYGSFAVAGLAYPTQGTGTQALGPFSVAFSDTSEIVTVTVNTTATVPVPVSAAGVAIIPPATGTASLLFKTVGGDTGTYLSPYAPSFIEFDTINNHVPANIYLVSGASTVVVVQFL